MAFLEHDTGHQVENEEGRSWQILGLNPETLIWLGDMSFSGLCRQLSSDTAILGRICVTQSLGCRSKFPGACSSNSSLIAARNSRRRAVFFEVQLSSC